MASRQHALTVRNTRAASADQGYDTAAGVKAILGVAARHGYATRRLRRRPITLAEEFYRMVEA